MPVVRGALHEHSAWFDGLTMRENGGLQGLKFYSVGD
ncbi:hypothetical protein SAMN05443582_103189 [Phyllobacterium sp. OV277]|nr:hypothetical protein SAMN05443582_103189 [Phyllobacterium sp. OV277]